MTEVHIGMAIGIISIIGTLITAITFFNRLRWEIDALKKENTEQERNIGAMAKEVRVLSEKGSIPTVSLEKRIDELERRFKDLQSDLTEIKIDIKAILKINGVLA